MDAYLGFQSLASVAKGTYPRPAGTDATDEMIKWDNTDQSARGAIILRLTPSVRSAVISKATSNEVWEYLKEKYGKPGLATVYSDFKRLVTFQISGNDPRPEIAQFKELVDRLVANKVVLDEFIKAMIFVNALPAKYNTMISMVFQSDREKIRLDDVANIIVNEYERLSGGNGQVNKMTAIKRKTNNPSFKHQRQQEPAKSEGSGSNAKPKTNRGNAGGNKKKEKKNQQHKHHTHHADGDVSDIASAVLLGHHVVDLAPHVPQPSTTSVTAFTADGPVVRKVPVNLPAKAFSPVQGAKIEKIKPNSVWPTVAQAQKICEALSITKNARNLRTLEESEMSKASDAIDAEAPPAKRARTETPEGSENGEVATEEDDYASLFGDDAEGAMELDTLDTGYVNETSELFQMEEDATRM